MKLGMCPLILFLLVVLFFYKFERLSSFSQGEQQQKGSQTTTGPFPTTPARIRKSDAIFLTLLHQLLKWENWRWKPDTRVRSAMLWRQSENPPCCDVKAKSAMLWRQGRFFTLSKKMREAWFPDFLFSFARANKGHEKFTLFLSRQNLQLCFNLYRTTLTSPPHPRRKDNSMTRHVDTFFFWIESLRFPHRITCNALTVCNKWQQMNWGLHFFVTFDHFICIKSASHLFQSMYYPVGTCYAHGNSNLIPRFGILFLKLRRVFHWFECKTEILNGVWNKIPNKFRS